MKLKQLIVVLAALIVVLLILFSFSLYDGLKKEEIKEETYIAEEVIQEEDIIPDETEEVPTIEESEQDVDILSEVTVEIYEGKFYPDEVIISPGTTVIWINRDQVPHKLVAYDRVFYGPRMSKGGKYAFTFTQEGTHKYFDAVFPKTGRGTITVKEEPLPITGGVVGADLDEEESNGKFALLILLFGVMIFALSHGMYSSYRT